MRLHFLGTSAGMPTHERNVSGLGVQPGERTRWMLFDCGEGTQHRLLRSPLRVGSLERIFLSHLHGDHCYGLFGLLSSRSMSGVTQALELCGPRGVERLVRDVLERTGAGLDFELIVRELGRDIEFSRHPGFEDPSARDGARRGAGESGDETESDDESRSGDGASAERRGPGESVADGSPRRPAGDPRPFVDEAWGRVDAFALSHDVPSFAWRITEPTRGGRLDAASARAAGAPDGPAMGRLASGRDLVLDDGRVLRAADFVGESRRGRRIVIAGDNDDPDALLARCGEVDLLVHEATHTEPVQRGARQRIWHSTAARVASAAARHSVGALILTHFSARYASTPGPDRRSIEEVRDEARAHYAGPLALARDLEVYRLDGDGALWREALDERGELHPEPIVGEG